MGVWLPQTRAAWVESQWLYSHVPALATRLCDENTVIKRNADWLLANLYKPHSVNGARVSTYRLRAYGLEHESINWGDISATVEELGGVRTVTLEEATPGLCPALCAYIHDWLAQWGWPDLKIETVW